MNKKKILTLILISILFFIIIIILLIRYLFYLIWMQINAIKSLTLHSIFTRYRWMYKLTLISIIAIRKVFTNLLN